MHNIQQVLDATAGLVHNCAAIKYDSTLGNHYWYTTDCNTTLLPVMCEQKSYTYATCTSTSVGPKVGGPIIHKDPLLGVLGLTTSGESVRCCKHLNHGSTTK